MVTERFKERLSATPTLFPTIVERLRHLRRVRRSVPSLQFPGDRLLVQSVKSFHVCGAVQDLWPYVCNGHPCGSRKKC